MSDIDNEMIEIFTEECTALLAELRESLSQAMEAGAYTLTNIQDIFRSIHTLKADATMMFYENIAEISRSFEGVLYFLRDEEKEVKDQSRFHYLLEQFVDYVSGELEKIESGHEADGNNQELVGLIADYPLDSNQRVTTISEPFQGAEPLEEGDHTISAELAQKISAFYIPGSSAEMTQQENAEEDVVVVEEAPKDDGRSKVFDYIERMREKEVPPAGQTREISKVTKELNEEILPRNIEQYNRRKHTIITEEDIEYLQRELEDFQDLIRSYDARLHEVSVVGMTQEDLSDFVRHAKHLERWIRQITTTDFSQVAEKMEGVTREMTANLGKKVDLMIVGERTLIDKSKKDKIAAAMIHILRNAIDHGIEEPEERKRLGKSETGTVLINITKKKEKHLRIDISDDGKGIDTEKILRKASEKGILYKAAEEFSEKEIFELTMIPGFSTSSKVSDYSGRGVGMDVVRHNIEEIGGTIKLHSKLGRGTKISIFL